MIAPWHHLFWIFLVPWLLALDGAGARLHFLVSIFRSIVRGDVPLAARWGDWVGPAALVALALLVWPRPAARA